MNMKIPKGSASASSDTKLLANLQDDEIKVLLQRFKSWVF